MFGFFYAEGNQRFLPTLSWTTAEQAAAWFRHKRQSWREIMPANPRDEFGFLNPTMGDIIAVRATPDTDRDTTHVDPPF